MAPMVDKDDEYGIDSSDEAELLTLADTSSPAPKRKSSIDEPPFPAKRSVKGSSTFACAVEALTKNFGFQTFQLKQEQVISRILSGSSAAVVFPTGGGKSLCYQIPALCFSELDNERGDRVDGDHGIVLIVSPLIALMRDQVNSLVQRGIQAASMDSSKTQKEYHATCQMLAEGELKMLYCAPERLNNEGFWQQMKHVRGGIRLLAVDEAHCISEWGHAFRPDYLKIARFAKEIKAERVICLTATATPRVAQDICDAFDIDPAGLFRTSTYRPNLRLLAESGNTKKELYPKLFAFLEKNKGASIIYVTLQKQTEELATLLRARGFKARAFHAGMDTAVKTQYQDEFMRVDDLIMVATIAFGMGIDKASIRNVVHFNIPSSLESYSQEIGRAGRDGKISNCMFYVCGEDLHLREMFARGDLPSKKSVRGLLNEIFDPATARLPVGHELKAFHTPQEKDFDIRPTTLKNIYAQLEITHSLIRATTPIYTKYSFKDLGFLSPVQDQSVEAVAVRSFARKAKTLYTIDVEAAASHSGIGREGIVRKLNEMNDGGVLELKPAGVQNVYKITKKLPNGPKEIEDLVTAIYSVMENREREALKRTDEMLELITAKACFSRSLAQHFGDDLPDRIAKCEHCTWCMTQEAVVQGKPLPVPFNQVAFRHILETVQDRDDPRLLARIAFGISSPRITQMRLGKSPIFGSMDDHEFLGLVKAFTAVCER